MSLGKILGIPVHLHFSWFVILFLTTILFARYFDGSWSTEERWLAGLGTSLLLFMSVLFHELSHSLVAIRRGIPVYGITLFILGGVSQIAREADKPSTEFLIAVVGPLSSIILGFLFLGLAIGLEGVSQHLSTIAGILFSVNIGLAIFNMLPGSPLDGGRVLKAVVWRITRNQAVATKLATMGGQAVAIMMIVIGITLAILDSAGIVRGVLVQGLWLVVLGIFLQMMASASLRQFRLRESLNSYQAKDLMAGNCPVAPADVSLSRLMEEYIRPSGSDFLVLTKGERVQGVIIQQSIEKIPRSQWDQIGPSSVMSPLDTLVADSSNEETPLGRVVAVGPEEAAYHVMELMESKGLKRVLVIDQGVLLGFIGRDRLRSFTRLCSQSRN